MAFSFLLRIKISYREREGNKFNSTFQLFKNNILTNYKLDYKIYFIFIIHYITIMLLDFKFNILVI
jgi:hypothetical protein